MAKKKSTTELRFLEGRGTRFLTDGETVRCQCVAKGQLDRIRLEEDDPNLEPEDVWPRGQCTHGAVPGTFMCKDHGGNSPDAQRTDPYSFLPGEMAEKIKILEGNPHILSRQAEIMQLIARNMVLWERIRDGGIGKNSQIEISKGLSMIESGEVQEGTFKIREILIEMDNEREMFAEIRENMVLLKDMTRTQIGTMKDLKQMISTDQFVILVVDLVKLFEEALATHVIDRGIQQLILGTVQTGIDNRIRPRLASGVGSSNQIT